MTTLEIIGLVGSIASIIGFFVGFVTCKIKYKINTQTNWFFGLITVGNIKQKNVSKQED